MRGFGKQDVREHGRWAWGLRGWEEAVCPLVLSQVHSRAERERETKAGVK